MSEKTHQQENISSNTITRRDFIKYSGMAVIGACVINCKGGPGGNTEVHWGFLLVDMKKCQGCMSCMLACSLTHHGVENLSLSRIQVLQNPFEPWPKDLSLVQCRQCVEPACVAVCPTGALSNDPAYGNVTTVNIAKCIGCQRCVGACPYKPSRAIWNFEENHSQKCDLCAYTPHWNEKGGPEGKQACREICPLGAIVFTRVIPDQEGDAGYNVNLRGEEWARLGYPTD
jgi:protein NrfC